jgi:hypothetical protein
MKKIIALFLVTILAMSFCAACASPTDNQPTKDINNSQTTKPTNTPVDKTEPTEPEILTPPETEPPVESEIGYDYELDYSAFESNGEVYTFDDKIAKFPYFAKDEDFWRLARFNSFYDAPENTDGDIGPSTWDDIKDIPVNKFKAVGTGVEDNFPMIAAFGFNDDAQEKTVGAAILDGDWSSLPVTLKTATHIKLFFPSVAEAKTVSEMIVANYGQPTVMYIDEETDSCNLGYSIDKFELIIDIVPAPGEHGDTLPYEITIQLTQPGA